MLQGPTSKAELARRAERGAESLRHYPGYLKRRDYDLLGDEDFIDLTVDLITDLLHLAKVKWGADPETILGRARLHFDVEQAGEQ